MQILACYLLGVCILVPATWWATSRIGRAAEAPLPLHLLRIEFRCLTLALAFAPTAVVAGYVAFPAPASLVLASRLVFSRADLVNPHIRDQISWSIDSLVLCFTSCSAIYLASFFCGRVKRDPLRIEARMGASTTTVCASLWSAAFAIIGLVMLFIIGSCSRHDATVIGP
jgi:hypothetical protein